ncbi:MAG: TonB-dependent receptor [Phenylobacterium sp.]|nr:TonB-dependent receptor [Phenylobacterium sp.]
MLAPVLAAVSALSLAEPETASPGAPPPEATAQLAERGVISYPPSFFAEVGPSTALDMVQRLPGFSFDRGAAVRGLSGAGGNVLIDGEPPVSKNDSLEEILRRIPVSSVLRIDVIRGGAPGIDMQGRTVIANVIRKSSAGLKGAFVWTMWPISDGRFFFGPRGELQWREGQRLVELSFVIGKGPQEMAGDGTRIRVDANGNTLIRSKIDNDAQGSRRWLVGAYETPLAGGRLRLNGAYIGGDADGEYYDKITYPSVYREFQYFAEDRAQSELGLRWNRRAGPNQLDLVAFQQWNKTDNYARFDSPTLNRLFRNEKDVSETVGRVHFRRTASPTLNLEAGIEGALNTLDSVTSLRINNGLVPLPAANVTVEERRGEAFAVAVVRASPQLAFEFGLRHEASTVTSSGDVALEKSLSFTKPRVTVTWSPMESLQVRARIEREVTQLNFDDFVANNSVTQTGAVAAGNPDLSPMQAWVGELAIERRFLKSGVFTLTLRRSELKDVIDRAPVYLGSVVADAPANIGDGWRNELQVSLSTPLDGIGLKQATLKAQASLRQTEVTDPTTGRPRPISALQTFGPPPQISAVRDNEWELHYTQDLPYFRSTWGFDIFGPYIDRYYRLTEIETLKSGVVIQIFGEWKAQPDLSLRVELQSLVRDTTRVRDVWSGPRNTAPLQYRDFRDLQYDGAIQFRLRKTFG